MLSLSQGASAASAQQNQPQPVYGGDKTADAGDEVRFSVSIERVKGLEGMYVLSAKRLKGSAWSYSYIYQDLLQRVDLGAV
jgi:protein-serine/threonine kinase